MTLTARNEVERRTKKPAKRLRADATLRDFPVIARIAHAITGDRERYIDAGCNDYASKPIVEEYGYRVNSV